MKAKVSIFLAMFLVLLPGLVARETVNDMNVKAALASSIAKKKLLDIPVFFKGQKHPAVAKTIGNWKANHHTRGAFRSDEDSCHVAFVSAIYSLQQRCQREGGDAVINIKSVTRNNPLESATKFRCVAGSTVVHVAFTGDVVKYK